MIGFVATFAVIQVFQVGPAVLEGGSTIGRR
jgi:hypothetical protein